VEQLLRRRTSRWSWILGIAVAAAASTNAQSGSCTDGSYRCAVLNDNPAFYARLTDASQFDLASGPAPVSVPGAVRDDSDTAIELMPGTSLRTPTAVTIDTSGNYTVELWFKPEAGWNGSETLPASIFLEQRLGEFGVQRLGMGLAVWGKARAVEYKGADEIYGSGFVQATGLNPLRMGQWNHLVFTVEQALDEALFVRTAVSVYLNGRKEAVVDGIGTPLTTPTRVVIRNTDAARGHRSMRSRFSGER